MKPICTYGIRTWVRAIESNIETFERRRYDRNDTIHRDTMIASVQDEITEFARKRATRLAQQHTTINSNRQLTMNWAKTTVT